MDRGVKRDSAGGSSKRPPVETCAQKNEGLTRRNLTLFNHFFFKLARRRRGRRDPAPGLSSFVGSGCSVDTGHRVRSGGGA